MFNRIIELARYFPTLTPEVLTDPDLRYSQFVLLAHELRNHPVAVTTDALEQLFNVAVAMEPPSEPAPDDQPRASHLTLVR